MVAEENCGDEWECTGLGAARESFKEADEIVGIIKGLERTSSREVQVYCGLVQEQPHELS